MLMNCSREKFICFPRSRNPWHKQLKIAQANGSQGQPNPLPPIATVLDSVYSVG